MSRSVFVSHATKDAAIAAEIVELIEDGIGVPEAEIFCSSLDGYSIPTGKNFVTFMKEQMLEPKVVILLLTPAYFESKFCLSELGAAWVKSHYIFPILVPPLGYDDVKDVLLGTQVSRITDDIKFNELRDHLVKEVSLDAKSSTKWDVKRRAFLTKIDPLIARVLGPTMVPAENLKAMEDKLAEAHSELDESEQEIANLRKQLVDMEQLKDRQAVAELKASYRATSDIDVTVPFDEKVEAVRTALNALRVYHEVKIFLMSDHYEKPYRVMSGDRDEFDEASRRGFLENGEFPQPNWESQKMRKLKDALREIDEFAVREANALQDAADSHTDLLIEPFTQDFWEAYYF
ncbi:toll/interleukin-1 receptor domain-containing protein [Rhizobium ruizarguesonis]|uniref:toll/interleukin-1 receptor domain-containing protein n=1 Tax=Rhizobium ruizarguesonis TaxID=2081791 RepID=UPI0010322E5F|nr:toll/interleukin-1 receptor domain-containing protein [Rhizobium ruizarguesonis]TAW15069.1 toll/interleukin-1 receptor domain-containing protein [Rhizobium ruizarguesonis]